MYLKSIELLGFKSFAKKSELVFSSPISAIVGPNGSGKSNIAEAFRFVLGEQSMKSMRGKKGEDMIWNGAGDSPRASVAKVKLVFDNTRRILPLDFNEVSIERAVYRDGVNEYLLNGSQVRLKDVVEMLSSAHIGASGHHIISQGEADRILNTSAKERRSMIEDALGLKLYQYKKVESQRKLEKTRENIEKVESLRREIAPHLRFLKKQVEKVEKAIELREELKQKSLEYCFRENEYIKKRESEIQLEKRPLDNILIEAEKKLAEARQVLEKADSRDQSSDELLDLDKNLRVTREQKDKLLSLSGRLDGEISSISRMIAKQKEVENSAFHKNVSLSSVESLNSTITEKILDAKNSNELSVVLHLLDEILSLFSNFIQSNRENIDSSLMAEAEKDLDSLYSEKKKAVSEAEEINKKELELQKKYTHLKEKIESEKDKSRDAEKAVFQIVAEEGDIKSKLAFLKSEREKLEIISSDFKRELVELAAILGSGLLHFDSLKFDLEDGRTKQEERRRIIEKLKIRLEEAGSSGGDDVLKEFRDTSERDTFLERELGDLKKSAESLSDLISDLDQKLTEEFKGGIEKINHQFREFFQLMFGGGEAELSVITETKRKKFSPRPGLGLGEIDGLLETSGEEEITEGAVEEGIDIEVSLPKKKIKGLLMLSGGERALTSIALLFALSQVNPPPFVILDETDAALDEANSKKYGDMVENLSKLSQLIVITHNRETMSRAGILYGVTMSSTGGSKILSVAFDEAIAVAK